MELRKAIFKVRQSDLNGGIDLLEWDLFSRRRVWFHGSHLRQAPRLIHGISNLGRLPLTHLLGLRGR